MIIDVENEDLMCEISDCLYDDPVDFRTEFNDPDCNFRLVYTEDGDDRRWSKNRTYIIQDKDNQFHMFTQEIGHTEYQEDGDLEYYGPVEFNVKTVTVEKFTWRLIK